MKHVVNEELTLRARPSMHMMLAVKRDNFVGTRSTRKLPEGERKAFMIIIEGTKVAKAQKS